MGSPGASLSRSAKASKSIPVLAQPFRRDAKEEKSFKVNVKDFHGTTTQTNRATFLSETSTKVPDYFQSTVSKIMIGIVVSCTKLKFNGIGERRNSVYA